MSDGTAGLARGTGSQSRLPNARDGLDDSVVDYGGFKIVAELREAGVGTLTVMLAVRRHDTGRRVRATEWKGGVTTVPRLRRVETP